jgi:protein TonB
MITTRQKLTRYSGSLLLVLAVHAIAIVVALRWPASQAIELPPAAMMVELAPMPEPAPPPPPQVVEPPPPVEEEVAPVPEVVEAPKPEIVVPKKVEKPKPKPKPQPPKPVKKPEPPQEKPVDEKPVDTPPTTAKTEPAAPAPSAPPAPPSNALPNWQSDLLRHLSKYKKYPEDARRRGMQGVARLRFVVDAQGNVLSYSIASSSGSPSLDRATTEMIRRAQPLPKPPAETLNNGTIEILAPFVYSLDKR